MADEHSILVVDNEKNILESIKARLEYKGFKVDTATSGKDALSLFKKNNYSTILTDLYMPGMDGFKLMYEIRNYNREVPIIFLADHSSLEKSVESIMEDAYNLLEKTHDAKYVSCITNAVYEKTEKKQNSRENGFADKSGDWPKCFSHIIAESMAMKRVFKRIRKLLGCDITILIHGESGTGKELVARTLHSGGIRAKKNYVIVDCGATHDLLAESELFGHVKGSFTNAHTDKKGLLELADGGTLFLDEVAGISRNMQMKYLRVIQEGEIRRVGDTNYKKIDIRIISATNLDLWEAVTKGTFREDLYYRLKVIQIKLPPLRERIEDIPVLANYFLKMFSKRMNKNVYTFEDNIIEMMLRYLWPGNVRELKNFVEAAVAVSSGGIIGEEDIAETDLLNNNKYLLKKKVFSSTNKKEGTNLKLNERELIIAALKKANWVQKEAAKLLGISSRVINYKIHKMEIDCKANSKMCSLQSDVDDTEQQPHKGIPHTGQSI